MAEDLDTLIARGYIDSRDLIERLEELRGAQDTEGETPADPTEIDELRELERIADECEGYGDWRYGETLIPEDDFEDYAQQLADDIGAIDRDARWPLSHIDWKAAADELRQDYTEVEIYGRSYLMRA